jgi:hypothetical protein
MTLATGGLHCIMMFLGPLTTYFPTLWRQVRKRKRTQMWIYRILSQSLYRRELAALQDHTTHSVVELTIGLL